MIAIFFAAFLTPDVVKVSTAAELRQAMQNPAPGLEILLAPGEYAGGFHFVNVKGVTIRAENPKNPPRIVGGANGIQLSSVSDIEIDSIVIEKQTGNGLNIDDGGKLDKPSTNIRLKNLHVRDLPKGNHDGIKLSGVKDFRVEDVVIERWGGSAIDMVGCHDGLILRSAFHYGGDNGVQTKGGSSQIQILRCLFVEAGERGVNIGGSTGLEFFRPPIDKTPAGTRAEARNISVSGSTFFGGTCAAAFVGVDEAVFSHNTIYHPKRWALRILQETRQPGFVPSRKGEVSFNLVIFRSDQWVSGGVNVGDATDPKSFKFSDNWWFCSDKAELSRPTLPTEEKGGVYNQDPGLLKLEGNTIRTRSARSYGAEGFPEIRI